jgi:L-ascorbate metabolism protein UlaG (beta-lactamase superfamily)
MRRLTTIARMAVWARTMQIRYIANACFQITLANGKTLLTDPWIEGPCQQSWFNFPPVSEALRAEVYAAQADALYISHLHHDHLHPQTLAHIDRATPVLIGKMNAPALKLALTRLGFSEIIEMPFEERQSLAMLGCEAVLFRDFHGNTQGDDTLVAYDLDTSLYLYDTDGSRLFNAVDNTILPADATRIAAQYGAPDVAILPYASASLYPMAMADFDGPAKAAACARIRARAAANFAANFEAIGARAVVPAGGEYVLGGPAAAFSQYLPQPLETQLAAALGDRAGALRKLYPGDRLDVVSGAVKTDPGATFRDFTDAQRADYALGLADHAPSYTQLSTPVDLPIDWVRILRKCAANYHQRRLAMALSLPMDVYLEVVSWPERKARFLFRIAMDSDAGAMVREVEDNGRQRLTYVMDEKLLFSVATGLLNWNAVEASVLIQIRRQPDVYTHDLHRSIVHFSLLA